MTLRGCVIGFLGILSLGIGSAEAGNVIFVTVDGVRYQEFFDGVRYWIPGGLPPGAPVFPRLWESIGKGEAIVFGSPENHGKIFVGNNAALSLPGYRSLLSGEFEDRCDNNQCPNTDRETIFDGLVTRGWGKESMATFASWSGIGRAIESRPGRIERSVEFEGFPDVRMPDSDRSEINSIIERAKTDRPVWGESRFDKYTYALGEKYLAGIRPRFLYLSFVDSDDYGHLNWYHDYINSIVTYDGWIAELRDRLAKMGDYGDDTSIVVTTDHGRAWGPFWGEHGRGIGIGRSSFRTWAVVIPSKKLMREGVHVRKASSYHQMDIRPTIEMLLGVPSKPDAQGKSMIEQTVSVSKTGQ